MTAKQIADRIQQKLGSAWKDTPVDTFVAGKPDTEVIGIVTTFAPTLEVLRKSVAGGRNLIISRESPYWARAAGQIRPGTGGTGPGTASPEAGAAGRGPASMEKDPVYRAKRDYINANNLIVYRFFDNWNARQPDPQVTALAKALGWEKNLKLAGNLGFASIPAATLKETAQSVKKALNVKGLRAGGDPNIRVSKAAISHGMYWIADLQAMLAEPGVDLIVVGEPQWENELSLYNFDLQAAGIKKGMIVLGQQVSEEPGCGAMAGWLKSFISDVPVEWIPAGEPGWMPN